MGAFHAVWLPLLLSVFGAAAFDFIEEFGLSL
jgi:hypothetical protein